MTEPQRITTRWTSGGIEQVYETLRQDGETASEHADRHLTGLEAKLSQYPPD